MRKLVVVVTVLAAFCFSDSLKSNIIEIQKSLATSLDEQDFRFSTGVFAFDGAAEIRQKYRGLSENLVRCGYENPLSILVTMEQMRELCPETAQALAYWTGVESNVEEAPVLKKMIETQMMSGAGFIVRSGQLKALVKQRAVRSHQ